MTLKIAVQMDPIARINIRGDSTFALLLEAQKRGHGISYYTPDKLSLRGEELVAPVQPLTVRDEVGDSEDVLEPLLRRDARDGSVIATARRGRPGAARRRPTSTADHTDPCRRRRSPRRPARRSRDAWSR